MVADSTTDQVTVSWRTGPSATDAPYNGDVLHARRLGIL